MIGDHRRYDPKCFSARRFSSLKAGMTENPEKTDAELYDYHDEERSRYIEKCNLCPPNEKRFAPFMLACGHAMCEDHLDKAKTCGICEQSTVLVGMNKLGHECEFFTNMNDRNVIYPFFADCSQPKSQVKMSSALITKFSGLRSHPDDVGVYSLHLQWKATIAQVENSQGLSNFFS